MSSKKPRSRPRPKISFAVDREEIGITSEWADTFLPDPIRAKTATGANEATEAGIATEAAGYGSYRASEASPATGQQPASVEDTATVANHASVVVSDAVAATPAVGVNATHAANATVAIYARKPRAKPLRSVADGLTPGQFIVYTQMYAKGEGEGTRFYRGGYQSLCAMTGLSKRGIQNVIGDLQAKQVVSIETAPGHNPSQVSVYRVRSEPDILKDWYAAGLRFVLGKGKILLRQPQ